MEKDDLLQMMGDIPFFEDMNKAEREELLSFEDHWMNVPSHKKVLNEGDVDTGFFVLIKGSVSITKTFPTETHLAYLMPGGIFGEVTLRNQRARNSNVMADEDCVILKVDHQLLAQLNLKILVKVKSQIIELLIDRLDEVNHRMGSFLR